MPVTVTRHTTGSLRTDPAENRQETVIMQKKTTVAVLLFAVFAAAMIMTVSHVQADPYGEDGSDGEAKIQTDASATKEYTLRYLLYPGDNVGKTMKLTAGSAINLDDPVCTGFRFENWVETNTYREVTMPMEMPANNLTLRSMWAFSKADFTGENPAAVINHDGTLRLPNLQRTYDGDSVFALKSEFTIKTPEREYNLRNLRTVEGLEYKWYKVEGGNRSLIITYNETAATAEQINEHRNRDIAMETRYHM